MATITGTIKEPNGVVSPRILIQFAMAETVSVGTAVYPKDTQSAVTGTDGTFSVDLVAGDWIVTIKGESFNITVGNEVSYDLKDIITDGASYPSTLAATFGFFQAQTIAEMQTIDTSTVNKLVTLLGRSSAGDGGGGTFWWDSTGTDAHDGYMVVRPNDYTLGVWRRATDGIHSLTWFGGNGNGSTNNASALTAANSNSTVYVIGVPPGTYRVSTNVTISAGKCLNFANGAKLSIDSGVTVTIAGTVQAGLWQIFSGSGSVSLTGRIREVPVDWFGAAGDGSTDDSTAASKAFAAAPLKSQVYYDGRTYILDAVTTTRDVGLKLHQNAVLKHKASATSNMISYTGACTSIIEGGTLDGNKDAQTLFGASHTRYACLQTYSDGMRVRDLVIQNYTLAGINDFNTRTKIYIQRVDFVDGAEHGGTYRADRTEQSSAIQVTATASNINPRWIIEDCHVWQTSDPSATGKAPGGFIFGGVVSTDTLITPVITRCTFKKIGQTFPRTGDANHIGCIDFYEGTTKGQIVNCEFTEIKYCGVKCQNSFAAHIEGNYADGIDSGILEADGAALVLVDVTRTLGNALTDYGHTIISNNRLFDAGNCACIRVAGRGTASTDEIVSITISGNRCKNSAGRALQIVNSAGTIRVEGGDYVGAGPSGSSGAVEVQNLDAAGKVIFSGVSITPTANHGLWATSGISGSIYVQGGVIANAGSGTTAIVLSSAARLSLKGVTLDGTSGGAYAITGASTLEWYGVNATAGSRSITWVNITNAEGDLEGTGSPEGVVKALKGRATFRRLDGAAGTILYTKSTDTGSATTTLWSALS
jgi:hypothetical protein